MLEIPLVNAAAAADTAAAAAAVADTGVKTNAEAAGHFPATIQPELFVSSLRQYMLEVTKCICSHTFHYMNFCLSRSWFKSVFD